MPATFKVSRPDEIDMELTIKLPLRDWKALKKQVQSGNQWNIYPSWKLIEWIEELINKAEIHFHSKEETD